MLQQMIENIPMSQATNGKTEVVFRFNMSTIITFVVAQIIVFIVILVIAKIMGRLLEYMWSDYLEQPSQYLWQTWFKRIFTMHDTEVLLQISSIKLGKTRQLHVSSIPGHPTQFQQ